MNKIFFYKNKFYFLSFTVIFLAGLLIISNSNYSYFDYFYLENKYYDFFLGFIFSIFIFAILYKITNNQIILSCWVIKSFFVFIEIGIKYAQNHNIILPKFRYKSDKGGYLSNKPNKI